MDNVYAENGTVQGRLREDKKTYAFFLDIYIYRKPMILCGMIVCSINCVTFVKSEGRIYCVIKKYMILPKVQYF